MRAARASGRASSRAKGSAGGRTQAHKRAVPFAGRRPGADKPSRRGKSSSARSPIGLASGLLSAVSTKKGSPKAKRSGKRAKRSRKGPALLAALGGVGAAAAAFKRRQSTRQQSPATSAHASERPTVTPVG
jgi:hypothetical protein